LITRIELNTQIEKSPGGNGGSKMGDGVPIKACSHGAQHLIPHACAW